MAQIGSAILLNEFEVVPDSTKEKDNDIAYIKGWADHLKDNKSEIVRASHLAENAVNYFLEKAEQQIMLSVQKDSISKMFEVAIER